MSEFFDDDNYNDGFNEDSFEQGMDLGLWRQLLAYTLSYPKDVLILAICAVCTAGADIAFPLITRSVIDSIGAGDGSFDPYFYGALYFTFVVILAASVAGFIWYGGKL